MDMKTNATEEMQFRIGEVAAMFDISTKTLRIYDRIGLLKPSCINSESNYRYYSSSQIHRLEVILNLKKVGFSLSEISLFINSKINNNEIITLFQTKHLQLQKSVDALQYNMEIIEGMLDDINKGALVREHLTEQEKTIILSRLSCLGDAKLEESLAQILWL